MSSLIKTEPVEIKLEIITDPSAFKAVGGAEPLTLEERARLVLEREVRSEYLRTLTDFYNSQMAKLRELEVKLAAVKRC